jgi:parallel beta-helix repeat protein
MEMNYNLLFVHVIVLSLFLSVLSIFSNNISLANASPELQNNLIQIPSEATDFPGNNQQAIEILFTKASKSGNGDYHVKGSIKNIGENTLGTVKVTAQFFDQDNKTIGITTCCNASPSDIEPGHTSSFDSFASTNDMVGIPKYYKMSFDWKDGINELENNGNNKLEDTNTKSSDAAAQPTPLSDTEPVITSLSCGEVITKSVKLSWNLDCKTDGIIVGANDITVDLNGYTILGPGSDSSKIGIMLANNTGVQVIGPGTITNFQAGILNVGGKDNSINRTTFTDNELAIFNVDSKNTSIKENTMNSNEIGFSSKSSSGTVFKTNLLLSNALAGVTLVESQGNEVFNNIIKGSVNGIFLDGQSTLNNVNTNTVVENTGADLNNDNGESNDMNNNVFKDNKCITSEPDGLCTEE